MSPLQSHGNAALAVYVGDIRILFKAVFHQLLLVKYQLLLKRFGTVHRAIEIAVLHFALAELADLFTHRVRSRVSWAQQTSAALACASPEAEA